MDIDDIDIDGIWLQVVHKHPRWDCLCRIDAMRECAVVVNCETQRNHQPNFCRQLKVT